VIRVRRSSVKGPTALCSADAEDEQKRAAAHYWRQDNRSKEFSFKVYQDRSVRDALEKLFRHKCAYCETRIGVSDDSEIEHWRPKGAVKEDDGRRSFPAYYWLASNWDNLLLSCLKCNRPRKYRVQGRDEDEDTWERSGKGMLFPLAKGDVRATKKDEEAAEHPLLIDPCRENPAAYFEFVLFGDDPDAKASIRPKASRGRKRERGDRSIDVYSLNRPLLVGDRRRELTNLQRNLADFQAALETHDALSAGPLRDRQAQIMRSNAASILARLKPDSEYLLMTKQAVDDFLTRNPAVRRSLERALRAGG
jgi:uncharacterized protein (TIGR02646 family)